VTEDRVAGGVDFSKAIKQGLRSLQPGLLAEAHRGILYVDEVNLLDDHIVDIILDAAASGQNIIEREGISFRHPAQFILVGTMNPEEGELRPQLLDRFGLCVETSGSQDPEERVALMERREAFDNDPQGFIKNAAQGNHRLARQIENARENFADIRIPNHLMSFIIELCTENNVAGHRADLVMEQAARALAAMYSASEVKVEHIREVAPLVLIHRRREAQPPPPPSEPQPQDEEQADNPPEEDQEQHQEQSELTTSENQSWQQNQEGQNQQDISLPEQEEESQDSDSRAQGSQDQVFQIGETFKVRPISPPKDRLIRRGSGRRTRTRVSQKQGRYVKSCLHNSTGDIALDASLRAAAPFQKQRRMDSIKGYGGNGLAVHLTANDIRGKIREKRIGNFLLFAVDASGSMGSRGRMAASKGAVMSLLLDAYQKRDRVAMISFRRNEAVVNLPPTTSVNLASNLLAEMPVGGRTPLSAGLAKTYEQVRNILLKDPVAKPIVILITDGKSNVALGDQKPIEEALQLATAISRDERIQYVVVDTEEQGLVSFGLANQLAALLHAKYYKIDDLKAKSLIDIVKGEQP
jgi:magnesium chelatase subunit D